MLPEDTQFLVVDDVMVFRKFIKQQLEILGYKNVHVAENGIDGLELIEKAEKDGNPIKVVICDWYMPVMDGKEFCLRLRNDSRFEDLNIILISSEQNIPSIVSSIECKINFFLPKPITADILRKKFLEISCKIDEP